MDSAVFVASMNALASELDALPPHIAQMILTLLGIVEEQQGNIVTLLAANQTLLNVIDALKE